MRPIKALISASIGEFSTAYDFTVYAFLASTMAIVFFPYISNNHKSLIMVFTILFLGFVARPIGAIIFGHIGDRKGTSMTLSFTFIALGVPTVLIAFLPPFHIIGYAAPILLTLLRITQGISIGGEFTGTMMFLSDLTKNKKHFYSSFSWFGALLGTLFGSTTILLLHLTLSSNHIVSWGWRIPFLMGIAPLIIGGYLRHSFKQEKIQVSSDIDNKEMPLVHALKNNMDKMLYICGLNLQCSVLIFITIIYMPTYLTTTIHITGHIAFYFSTLTLFLLTALVPFFGFLGDKYHGRSILKYSAVITTLLGIPVFYMIQTKLYTYIGISQFILIISSAMAISSLPQIMVSLTGEESRYTSISLPYNLVTCLVGGSTPLVLTYIIHKTKLLEFPGYYLAFFSALTLLTVLLRKNNTENNIYKLTLLSISSTEKC